MSERAGVSSKVGRRLSDGCDIASYSVSELTAMLSRGPAERGMPDRGRSRLCRRLASSSRRTRSRFSACCKASDVVTRAVL